MNNKKGFIFLLSIFLFFKRKQNKNKKKEYKEETSKDSESPREYSVESDFSSVGRAYDCSCNKNSNHMVAGSIPASRISKEIVIDNKKSLVFII